MHAVWHGDKKREVAGHTTSTMKEQTADRKWGRAQGPSFPNDPLPSARFYTLKVT